MEQGREDATYMLILIAHQRILQPQSILPAAVSLLCDHHTQLLSLNCIPFLPFSPWSAPCTICLHSMERISSLLTLCCSCFILLGATPLWLSPMSPFTLREQAAASSSITVSTLSVTTTMLSSFMDSVTHAQVHPARCVYRVKFPGQRQANVAAAGFGCPLALSTSISLDSSDTSVRLVFIT